jgi:hypothetical protein
VQSGQRGGVPLQLVYAEKFGAERLLVRRVQHQAIAAQGMIPVCEPFDPKLDSRRRREHCIHLSPIGN